MITWLDKIDGFDLGNPQKNVNAADMNQIKVAVNQVETDTDAAQANIDSHEALTNNPHGVTKTQVGLSNVDNTSDSGKPVSTAQAAAIAVVQNDVNAHEALTNNPHSVTKTQVGLSDVDNTADTAKPVSTAQANAIAVVQNDVNAHEVLTNNPHSVTKSQVGLSNADNTSDATKLAAVLAMFVYGEIPSGTINGVNDDFTIANANPSKVALYSDGIRTNPANFSITGTALTITNAAVIPTNSLLIDYIK